MSQFVYGFGSRNDAWSEVNKHRVTKGITSLCLGLPTVYKLFMKGVLVSYSLGTLHMQKQTLCVHML